MKQLLAVSWAYPPILAPRSIQVQRTLHYLKRDHGWHTTLITVDPTTISRSWTLDTSLSELYGSGPDVQPVGSWENSPTLRLLWRGLPALSQLPDRQRVWVWRATRAARRMARARSFDALITFSQPVSDHLVGLGVRELGLPWVAHFSDPWTDNPYLEWAGDWPRRHNRTLERRVIAEADAVVFVSPQARDLVLAKYPREWTAKSRVIPQGFDRDVLPAQPEGPLQCRMQLCYAGSFYGSRSPRALIEAVERLPSELREGLEILFVGPMDSMARAALAGRPDCFRATGPVSYLESLRCMARADCLLLVDAPHAAASPFLPSKLIDYLAFHKPILGLTPGQGPAADLLREVDCLVAEPDDVSAIGAALAELLERWRHGRRSAPSRNFAEVAGRYEIGHTTGALARVLNGVAKSGGAHSS